MTYAPWRTDRPLDTALVAALVDRQFPELRPVTARPLGEGWDSEVFFVNEGLAFTFPKRSETVRPFLRGLALLPFLAERLPVAVPRPAYRGRPDAAFPYPFAGYPPIPGVLGIEAPPPKAAWPRLARQLGETLTRLHAIGPDELPVDVPRQDTDAGRDPMPESLVAALRRNVRDERIEPYLRGEHAPLPTYDGPRVLTHADLFDYHVVLSPDGDTVNGIIDWFDAGLGDPVGDFVGLFLWLGPAFLQLVIDAYEGGVDDGFRDRLHARAKIVALWEYGSGLLEGSPGDRAACRRYVKHAFPDSEGMGSR